MTFLHPEFIYMMLPILFILFGLLLTQSEVQEQFFSPRVLAKLRVDTNQLSAKVRNLFYFLMFLFIILALAGPVIEKGSAKVKVKGDPFYIALDVSASMLCEDVYPNRLEFAKLKVFELLKTGSQREIGLIAFAKSSYLVSPPTLDRDLLRFLLKPMQSGSVSEQGTNILTLLKAADKLSKEGEAKSVLIISDGGDKTDFTEEILYAKKHDIKVYVLGVGTKKGATIAKEDGGSIEHNGEPVISRYNPLLVSLATESGGRTIQADEVTSFLERRVEKVAADEEKPIYFHLFIVPIGFAMLMLLLATSSFHRGEKHYVPSLLILGLMVFHPQALEAGLFDYKRLDDANRAYKNEDYRESSSSYKVYAMENQSVEATYNAANGYYKMGRYKMAVGLYESIHFVEGEKNHQLYHNLGNALAKLGSETALKKAIEAYKKALKFREDNETRENLVRVEKALKKREQERRDAVQEGRPLASSSHKPLLEERNNKAENEVNTFRIHHAGRPMSEREANKWFKLLDQRQHGRLYKIEVANPDEGAENEKPW